MSNPILVEVKRGSIIESRHRGAIAIVDANGSIVYSLGDIDQIIFPRSSVKAIQALPMIMQGAADFYKLIDSEIALSVSSHSGEPEHIAGVNSILKKLGLDNSALECGSGPTNKSAAIHATCSGKHAGFICLACHRGINPTGYINSDHEVQIMVREALEDLTETPHLQSNQGVDGCSIPTYAIPIKNLALAFAKLGTGERLPYQYAQAAHRIRKAVAANPFFVAGTDRFDTIVMNQFKERVFIKMGAEGVYSGAFPELGYGIAIKCEDGSVRGCEVMMAAIIQRFLDLTEEEIKLMQQLSTPRVKTWKGKNVGEMQPTHILTAVDNVIYE